LVSSSSISGIDGVAVEAPSPLELNTHTSVSATHNWLSSKSEMEVFYGPTSDFALINKICREASSRAARREPTENNFDDVGDVLDAIPYRQIFFGVDAMEYSKALDDQSRIQFLQKEMAQDLLDKYLSTYHCLAPILPKDIYHEHLQAIFAAPASMSSVSKKRQILLIAIAIASLSTEHWHWGDRLFQMVKKERLDNVNLESVQLELLMISYFPAHSFPSIISFNSFHPRRLRK
jgi:hypothetical protein